MTILEALKTAVAAHTKPSLVVSVGQILLVVFFVAGCTTPIERAELSKGPLEQRFGPSNNRIDFPCSFGFQSSVLEYQKSMVQGQWWVGVCIIDLDKNSLYFGAPSPSDPRNLLKMSLHSADLKEYGSFSIIDRNRSLLSQAFGTRSAYPDSQLVLATRARLQRSNNAGYFAQYPKQRVVINFDVIHRERLSRYFSGFGMVSSGEHSEVRLKTQGEVELSPFEFVPMPIK